MALYKVKIILKDIESDEIMGEHYGIFNSSNEQVVMPFSSPEQMEEKIRQVSDDEDFALAEIFTEEVMRYAGF